MIAFYICKLSMILNMITAGIMMLFCLDCRYKKWQALLGCIIAAVMLIELKVRMQLVWPWQYFTLILIFSMLIYMRIFFSNSWSQLVLLFVLYLVTATVGEVFAGIFYFVIWSDSPKYFDWYTIEMVRMSGLLQIICLVLTIAAIVFWKKYLYRKNSTVIVILLFMLMQIVFMLYVPVSVSDNEVKKMTAVQFPCVMFFADTVLFYVFYQQEKKAQIQQGLSELAYLQEIERLYYEDILVRREEVCHLQQDFQLQLYRVKKMIQNKEIIQAQDLLCQMSELLESTREKLYCGHPVINAVLSQKETVCQQNDIDFHVTIMIKENITVQLIHLCNIFSNLLDNAIRANIKLQPEFRWIELIAAQEQSYLHIVVKNASNRPDDKTELGHGYGIQIVQDIVKQYNGKYSYSWDMQNRVYTAQILLEIVSSKNR